MEGALATTLYTVFGMDAGGSVYWSVVLGVALAIIGLVVLNQIANDSLVLKE